MISEDADGHKVRWIAEVERRVGGHSFADAVWAERSPLRRLLESVHRLHYVDKHFSRVQPPLPYLPALPLDDRWVDLRLSDGIENSPFARNRGLAELAPRVSVPRFLTISESVIVVGEPGAGKSTMMKWAARYLIAEPRSKSILPLFVSLRSYARWRARHAEGSILGFLAQQHRIDEDDFANFMADIEIASYSPNSTTSGLRGICKVLLDGWDEVPLDMRPLVRDDIHAIQHLLPVVVTSRPSGFVSSLAIETRYEITPMSYESMRLLVREWLDQEGKPELEVPLCLHLDRHISLRELARNPFVLTLLCAIVARDWPGPIPRSKGQIYSRLLEIARERCNHEFRTEGLAWTPKDISEAHAAALETLCDETGQCRYEFEYFLLVGLTRERERTAQLLESSRLITLAYEGADQWSFLHPTVHEFLAAMRLTEAGHGTNLVAFAKRPGWLHVVTFACGLISSRDDHEVWSSLREVASKMDRFGIVVLRLAAVLAEVGCNDGGRSLLGVDIRPELWRCFLRAPESRPYASALVELNPDYALEHLEDIQSSRDGVLLIATLYALLPPGVHGRQELLQAQLKLTTETGVTLLHEVDTPSLPSQLGFYPGQSHNLTLASETMSAPDILSKLSAGLDPILRRSFRIRLANLGGALAEEALTEAMDHATEANEILELSEALATLGTIGARDALMAKLRLIREKPPDNAYVITFQLLEALRGLPLEGADAQTILEIGTGERDTELRVIAVRALSNCQDERVLARLTDLMRREEPELKVRCLTMETLMKAHAFYGVRHLLREGLAAREDQGERRYAWDYVLASGVHAAPGPVPELSNFPNDLEPTVVAFLLDGQADPLHAHVAAGCRLLRWSLAIRNGLAKVALRPEAPAASRIAACEALTGFTPTPELVAQFQSLLREVSAAPRSEALVRAAADVLAAYDPTLLIRVDDPVCQRELWRAALKHGLLVHDEGIERPPAPLIRAKGTSPLDRPIFEHSLRSVFHEAFQARALEYLKILHPTAQEVVLKQGDGGKDIVVYGIGRIYACYAPARITDWREADIIAKMTSDLGKASAALGSAFKEWVFLHNHPQNALTNRLSDHVLKLREQHPGLRLDVWGIEQLWTQLNSNRT